MVSGDHAYLAIEYAKPSPSLPFLGSLRIVNISDPYSPYLVRSYGILLRGEDFLRVFVLEDYMYVVTGGYILIHGPPRQSGESSYLGALGIGSCVSITALFLVLALRKKRAKRVERSLGVGKYEEEKWKRG